MIDRIGIRARIAGGSVLIAALLCLVAGLVINAQIETIVREGSTNVLESDAAAYVTVLLNEGSSNFDPPGPDQLVAVVSPNGSVPVMTLPTVLRMRLSSLEMQNGTRLVNTDRGSYVVRSIAIRNAEGRYFVITARSADAETSVTGRMRVLLLVGLSGLVLAIALTAWVLTGVSLAPVRRLRASAERLSTSDSAELLPVGVARDDIRDLATTLNGMIGRLREAADRERHLVSDASHELRTPLAILGAQLEVATASPTDLASLKADLVPVEHSVERLSRLVVSLLELSRLESSRGPDVSVGARVLIEEITEAVERIGYRLEGGSEIDLRIVHGRSPDAGPGYSIPAEDMGRIVENLVGNAVRAVARARPDGSGFVEVATDVTAEGFSLIVRDDGPGMSEEFLPHALERFRREDESRAAEGGAGLGLPIVAAIVRRARGELALDNIPGSGVRVAIRIPPVPHAESDRHDDRHSDGRDDPADDRSDDGDGGRGPDEPDR